VRCPKSPKYPDVLVLPVPTAKLRRRKAHFGYAANAGSLLTRSKRRMFARIAEFGIPQRPARNAEACGHSMSGLLPGTFRR